MLSTTTVKRIAEELLEQARSSRFGLTDPAGMPVAPINQCPELRALPQGMQCAIVQKATWAIGSSPMFILAVVAWIAAIALYYALEPTLLGKPLLPTAFLILAPLMPLLLRALLVRRTARLIAKEVFASWPVAQRQ